jgi:hypothetical protein
MSNAAWFKLEDEKRPVKSRRGLPDGMMLHYQIGADALVTLEIRNDLGKTVRTLVDGRIWKSGPHDVYWDSRDQAGKPVRPGYYLYRMHTGPVPDPCPWLTNLTP